MKTFIKVLVGTVVLLLVLGLAVGAWVVPQLKKAMENRSGGGVGVEVVLSEVQPERLVRSVSAPGDTEARRMVEISSRVSAKIEELPFEEGETVKKGDLVVRLEDRDLQAALDQAVASLGAEEARLAGARTDYADAVIDWEREQGLYETGDVSLAQYEDAEARKSAAESTLNAAEKNVDRARASVEIAEENLRFATITSPIDGYVTRLNAEVGETVVTGTMNNAGTVILVIADLSEMLVRAEIDESDVVPVQVGQPARVYINAFKDQVFEGTVETVALQHSMASDGSKYFATEVLIHAPDGALIRNGLTANTEIEVETFEGVLKVPSQSVMDKRVDELDPRHNDNEVVNRNKTFAQVVYKFVDGKAVETPVEVGPSDLTTTAILAGLEPGDRVISGPWRALMGLGDDTAVRERGGNETEALAEADDEDGDASEAEAQPAAETSETADGNETGDDV